MALFFRADPSPEVHPNAQKSSAPTRVPMGAVAVSDDIYNTIINSGPEHGVEFFHGYTYSAHPACVAASHATLDIYENEGIFEKAKHMSSYFLNAVMDELKDLPIVTDIRGDGAGMHACRQAGA